MTSQDANPTRGRYRQVLAWRADGLTHAEIGRRLGLSRWHVVELEHQAQRWQERMAAP